MPSILTRGDRIVTVSGRESSLARPSVPYNAFFGGGAMRLLGDGRSVSYQGLYDSQTWVKVCVDKLAHQIASLPLKVFTKDSQGINERVPSGPLVELIREPWLRAGPSDLKVKIAFPALLHGNALLWKRRRNAASPIEGFRPLDWRFIEWKSTGSSQVDGFWTTEGGDKELVAPADTLHVHWESGSPVGVSPLMALGVALRLEDAAQRYASSNFDHSATPNMAVTLPPDAPYDDKVRSGIRDEVQRLTGGVDSSGGVLVFGGGASVETLSHNAREAELIEVRKLNREEVAAVYDIPPPMIGILDKATYSNINEQHRMLYMTVLRPWLTLIEERFEAQVIRGEAPMEGQFVEFDMAEVLKGDTKERAEAFKLFIESGVYTINEIRRLENLPPIDHPLGNRPLIPSNNNTPIDEAGDAEAGSEVSRALADNLARAQHRVLTRNGAGAEVLFDGDRFERELADDLASALDSGAPPFAAIWRAAVEDGIADANGDRDRLAQFFQALGAE